MHRALTAVLALSGFIVLFGILASGCSGPDAPKATGTSSSSTSPAVTSAGETKDADPKDSEAKESPAKEGDASGSEGSLTTYGK